MSSSSSPADSLSAFEQVTHRPAAHYSGAAHHRALPRGEGTWLPPCNTRLYTEIVHDTEQQQELAPAPIDVLLENHRAFLKYLERRVGDRDLAEDILQDAFAKVIDHPEQAPGAEGVVPWFYRALRNAAIDRFRRAGTASRALEAFARELETQTAPADEVEAEICACVSRLAATLKPEYAEAIRSVDIEGMAVKDFALRRGLTASNAGVRLFRGRDALKRRVLESCGTCAEHGCRNCTCRA